MILEREQTEYRALCTLRDELYARFLMRKAELRKILEETALARRDAFLVLARANRLALRLTPGQRQITGFAGMSGEIKARISQVNLSIPVLSKGGFEKEEAFPLVNKDCRSLRELKQMGLVILGVIDSIKKNLLQLDLLELRCRELIVSLKKALEAFRHEFRIIKRNIYPFGFFSLLCRSLRFLKGETFFSRRDFEDLSALSSFTGLVLKIADSPLM